MCRILVGHVVQQARRLWGALGQQGLGITHQGVSRGVLFPAPTVPARAPVPIGHHRHVTELASHAVAAPKHPTIDDQRPADTGSQGDARHDPGVPPRPELVLRPSGRIGVVVDDDR